MTQLVELQQQLPLLAQSGTTVYAVSYDPVSALADFALREEVTFSLLSDEGSVVITKLGLLNEAVFEQHAVYGFAPDDKYVGVPYPGVITLDHDGIVIDKVFHESYRERETGPGLLMRSLGIEGAATGPTGAATAEAVDVRVQLDAAEWKPNQRLWLTVDMVMAPGYHVYVGTAPTGVHEATIELEPAEGVAAGPAEWSDATASSVAASNDQTVRAQVPLTITAARGTGELRISGRVRFQACTSTTCLIPGSTPFDLVVSEGRFVRPVQR